MTTCYKRRISLTNLTVKGNTLLLDHKPIQLILGVIHYVRGVAGYWGGRLLKLKACGFNCVEMYVAWNLHEPKEGEVNFTGMADVQEFIRTAERVGMYVIVRPSP